VGQGQDRDDMVFSVEKAQHRLVTLIIFHFQTVAVFVWVGEGRMTGCPGDTEVVISVAPASRSFSTDKTII
jgi:hypothetical protein